MITLISDIHTEFWKDKDGYFNKPDWYFGEGDILVLAGDIAVGPNKLEQHLEHFSKCYNHVVYIFGNHEYYGYNLNSYDDIQVPDNVHILNPGTVQLTTEEGKQVTFIGATLWTNFNNDPAAMHAAAAGITDFKRIKVNRRGEPGKFSPLDCQKRYEAELNYLKSAIAATQGEYVLVTHFLPDYNCVAPHWQEKGGVLNYYFCNTAYKQLYPQLQRYSTCGKDGGLEVDLDPSGLKYWLFGHTHDRIDQGMFQANPMGYHGYEMNANDYKPLELK